MEITCPNCNSSYELSHLSEEEEVTQCVCEECKSNLVLVADRKKSGSAFSSRSSSKPSARSSRSKISPRQATITLVAVIIMCVANYAFIGGFIYGASQAIPDNLKVKKTLTTLVPSEPSNVENPTVQVAALTREDIQELLNNIDQAVSEKDVDHVMAYMSKDMNLTGSIQYPQAPQPKLFMMTRRQFEKNLQQTYEMAEDYEFSREIIDISIYPESQSAEVMSRTVESLTISGQFTVIRAKEIMKVHLRDGQPQITHVQAVGKVENS